MILEFEKGIKRFLKRKITITTSLLVMFMIVGKIGYSVQLTPNTVNTEQTITEENYTKILDKPEYQSALVVRDNLTDKIHGKLNLSANKIEIKNSFFSDQASGLNISAIQVREGGELNLGASNTKSIVLQSFTDEGIATGMAVFSNGIKEATAIVDGESLIINANSEKDSAFGLLVGVSEGDKSKVIINSDATKITAIGQAGHGMQVRSGGTVQINSRLTEISGYNVISTEEGALVEINKDNNKNNIVKLDGNISVTSFQASTTENTGVFINLSNDESYLNGNIGAVGNTELGISNGANWNMKGKSSLIGTVTLQGGTINLGTTEGLTITGNGLVMNGSGAGYDSLITGTGNIDSNISTNGEGNIFELGNGSKYTGTLTLGDSSTAENKGYLALQNNSNIVVGSGATFTNAEGATIVGTTNDQHVIEVAGGTAVNNGTIDLSGTTGSYAMYATANNSTLTNNGTIKVDYNGSKVFGSGNNISSKQENTNTGKIQINGYNGKTTEEAKKALDELLLGSEAINSGMYVDDNGVAIVFGDTVKGEMSVTDALNKVTANALQIDKEGATIKADGNSIVGEKDYLNSLNIAGNLELVADGTYNTIGIENVTTNIDSVSTIKIGSDLTVNFVNGTINGEKSNPAINIEKNGTLSLNGMTVNGNIGSDLDSFNEPGTAGESTLSMTGKNNINGNVDLTKIDIIGGESSFSSNSSFSGEMKTTITSSNDGIAKFEVAENGDNALLNTSKNNNSVTLVGKFGIITNELTEDKSVSLGESNDLTSAEFVSNSDKTQDIYLTDLDKDNNTIYAKYNKELLSEYGKELNDINNSFQVINDKVSQNKADRVALADKVYAGTIYAETVRAAYDNSKLIENEVLTLNPNVGVGEWAASGKALYMKNEDYRDGKLGNRYSSDSETTGLLATLEYGLTGTSNVGFAFAGAKQNLDTDTGSADTDIFYLGAFAKKEVGNYKLTAGLGYELNKFDTEENIFGGREKYDANVYSAYVEGRYSMDLGDNLAFEPKLKLGYTYVDQDSVKDSTYDMGSQDLSAYDVEVGADFVKSVALESGKLDVTFGASYAMIFGDTDDEFDARFYNSTATGSTFRMMGANLNEKSANFDLGVALTKDSGVFYNTGVTLRVGEDNTRNYGVTLGAGYRF